MTEQNDASEWCNECAKPLKPGEVYIWNGGSYCVVCINIVTARESGWRI